MDFIKKIFRNLIIFFNTKLFYRIVKRDKIILFSRIIDSDHFLQNQNKNLPSVMFWTTHKCASTFISKFLKIISEETNFNYFDYAGQIWELGNEIKVNNPFSIETDCDFLYRKHGEIYGPMRTPFEFYLRKDLNNIFFLRDPRDLIISKYYSIAYSHPIPSNDKVKEEFLKKREHAKSININDFFIEQIDNWILPHYMKYKDMRENSKYSSFHKYEDLKDKPKKIFLEITNNMNVKISEKSLDKLILEFEKPFKQKQEKKQDRKYLHERSGKSRQFEYELNKKVLDVGNKKLKNVLEFWNFKV